MACPAQATNDPSWSHGLVGDFLEESEHLGVIRKSGISKNKGETSTFLITGSPIHLGSAWNQSPARP